MSTQRTKANLDSLLGTDSEYYSPVGTNPVAASEVGSLLFSAIVEVPIVVLRVEETLASSRQMIKLYSLLNSFTDDGIYSTIVGIGDKQDPREKYVYTYSALWNIKR